jgi:hypothetical protein
MLKFSMPSPQELEHLTNFCKVMAMSPFYQKLGPGGVMAIYLTAKEYDLPFMACLNGGLHTFDGKVTFSALMIDALILKAGHKTEVLKLDNESCCIRFIRGDRRNDPNYQPFVYEYTIEKARKAGYLTKKNWQTSCDDMLYSRCMTGGARKHTPEVMVGVLVTGELVGDDRDGNVPPLIPTLSPENSLVPPSLPKPIQETAQIEHQPIIGYHEFFLANFANLDDPLHKRKLDYVTKTCEKSGMDQVKIINYAVQHPSYFEEKFRAWEKENFEDCA